MDVDTTPLLLDTIAEAIEARGHELRDDENDPTSREVLDAYYDAAAIVAGFKEPQ